mmetsp:Transcript_9671/g.24097  ORF Transcript_9671/g.24097 Transcript_9671/m.24097 type:complete len:307 (-) Transcript_9671:700-1620(-)
MGFNSSNEVCLSVVIVCIDSGGKRKISLGFRKNKGGLFSDPGVGFEFEFGDTNGRALFLLPDVVHALGSIVHSQNIGRANSVAVPCFAEVQNDSLLGPFPSVGARRLENSVLIVNRGNTFVKHGVSGSVTPRFFEFAIDCISVNMTACHTPVLEAILVLRGFKTDSPLVPAKAVARDGNSEAFLFVLLGHGAVIHEKSRILFVLFVDFDHHLGPATIEFFRKFHLGFVVVVLHLDHFCRVGIVQIEGNHASSGWIVALNPAPGFSVLGDGNTDFHVHSLDGQVVRQIRGSVLIDFCFLKTTTKVIH